MKHNRVYIAEGDQPLRKRLGRALQQHRFEVTLFDSGYPLVTLMDDWPDLFLIDIELPGINGLEICKWLKSHEQSRHIPVVFLSGESYLKILAVSAQADDYVEKPVNLPELIRKIRSLLVVEHAK